MLVQGCEVGGICGRVEDGEVVEEEAENMDGAEPERKERRAAGVECWHRNRRSATAVD